MRPVLTVNELQVSSLKFHDFYLIVQIHPLLMVGGFIVVSSEGQPILILKKPENNCDLFSSYILNSILKLVVEQYRHMMHLEFFLRFFFDLLKLTFDLGCVMLNVQPSLSSNLWEGRSGLRRRFT